MNPQAPSHTTHACKHMLPHTPTQYVGCFADSAALRTLPELLIYGRTTPQDCRDIAIQRGYRWYGLQIAGTTVQCWVGNADPRQLGEVANGCRQACTGDLSQLCGASFQSRVHFVGRQKWVFSHCTLYMYVCVLACCVLSNQTPVAFGYPLPDPGWGAGDHVYMYGMPFCMPVAKQQVGGRAQG